MPQPDVLVRCVRHRVGRWEPRAKPLRGSFAALRPIVPNGSEGGYGLEKWRGYQVGRPPHGLKLRVSEHFPDHRRLLPSGGIRGGRPSIRTLSGRHEFGDRLPTGVEAAAGDVGGGRICDLKVMTRAWIQRDASL